MATLSAHQAHMLHELHAGTANTTIDKAGLMGGTTVFGPGVHTSLLHHPDNVSHAGRKPFKGSIETAAIDTDTIASHPWGFRFHFNPNNVKIQTAFDGGVFPNQADIFTGFQIFIHQQGISFSLLLNRIPDMTETSTKNYYPSINSTDFANIKKWGTLVDLDYLYRAINGDYTVSDTNWKTSDIGYISPNIVKVTLGKNWSFLALPQNVSVTHQQFNLDMTPVMTQVDLDFVRIASSVSRPLTYDSTQAAPAAAAPGGNSSRTSPQ